MTQVRPENIYILMYTGGCGGEFLSQLISQHPGFATAKYNIGPSNGYHLYYDPPVQLNSGAGDSKAVFPAHPFDDRSKPNKPKDGIIIPPDATWIAAVCDPRYKRFFFLLFCIKTVLKRIPTSDLDAEFSEQIAQRYQRVWCYRYELDAWNNNIPIPNFREHMQLIYNLAIQGNMVVDKQNKKLYYDHSIDIGQLFFEDFDSEYTQLLNILGTQPLPGAQVQVANYHTRNLALIKHHTGTSAEQLISESDSRAWEIIYTMLVKFYRLV